MINWLEQHLVTCLSVKYLGMECPGCGMQRAFIALLRGQFADSLHYNPALLPFLITVVMLLFHLKFDFKHGARSIVIGFAFTTVLMVVNYVLKQVHIYGH